MCQNWRGAAGLAFGGGLGGAGVSETPQVSRISVIWVAVLIFHELKEAFGGVTRHRPERVVAFGADVTRAPATLAGLLAFFHIACLSVGCRWVCRHCPQFRVERMIARRATGSNGTILFYIRHTFHRDVDVGLVLHAAFEPFDGRRVVDVDPHVA